MKAPRLSTQQLVKYIAGIEALNGISALAGGMGLILNPRGEALGMQVEWLQSTPFVDFMLPGIILFAVNGLGNIWGLVLTLRSSRYLGYVAALFGIMMMVWINAQVIWIGYKSLLQPLYFTTGLIQFILGLNWIKKPNK